LTKMLRHSHWPPLTHVSCARLATISSRSITGEYHLRCFGRCAPLCDPCNARRRSSKTRSGTIAAAISPA